MQSLQHYHTLVFDCDGVILDSNRVKTEAFYQAALPYGEAAAQALVEYHVARGGISRYRKFEYFLQEILGVSVQEAALNALLVDYATRVRDGLLHCRVAEDLQRLRQTLPDSRWLIVSGGDQAELREVFAARGLARLFDGGIHGSPDAKDVILARELEVGTIRQPAIFLGDSRFDHQCAQGAGLDFIFVSGWSEFHDWPQYCAERSLPVVTRVSALLSAFFV